MSRSRNWDNFKRQQKPNNPDDTPWTKRLRPNDGFAFTGPSNRGVKPIRSRRRPLVGVDFTTYRRPTTPPEPSTPPPPPKRTPKKKKRKPDRRPTVARFPARCGACDWPILVGDEITPDRKVW